MYFLNPPASISSRDIDAGKVGVTGRSVVAGIEAGGVARAGLAPRARDGVTVMSGLWRLGAAAGRLVGGSLTNTSRKMGPEIEDDALET